MPSEIVRERIIEEEINREPVAADSSIRSNVANADTSLNTKSNKTKVKTTGKKSKWSGKSKSGKTSRVMQPTYVKMDKPKAQSFFHHNNTTPLWTSNNEGKSVTISQNSSVPKVNPIANLVGSVASKNGVQNQHVSNIIGHSATAARQTGAGDNLSAHGKILAKDTEEILYSVDRLFQNKNQGQNIQNFASLGASSIKQNVPFLQSKTQGVSRSAVSGKSKSAAAYVQRLGYTFVKSGDLRDIVSQMVSLFRELAASGSASLPSGTHSSVIPPTYTMDTTINTTAYAPVGTGVVPLSSSTTTFQSPIGLTSGLVSSVPSTPSSGFDLEKKQRLTNTLISLLSRLGSRQEYRKAVKDGFKLYDRAYGKANYLKNTSGGNLQTDQASAAKGEAWQFASMFFGEAQMVKFRNSSYTLAGDIRKDAKLNSFLQQFRHFVLNGIEYPESLQTYEKQEEAMNMITQLEMFMRTGNWGPRFGYVLDDFNAMITNLKNDPYMNDVGAKLSEFVKDFSLNNEGRPDLFVMGNSMEQLKMILLPMIRSHLSNIPIDRIDIASPEMDLVLEDLKFNLGDILPSKFNIDIRNRLKFDASDLSMGKTIHELKVEIRDITPILNKVKFYVHKKNGFKWLDWGLLDLAFRGNGMRIELDYLLTTHKSDGRSSTLKLHKIQVGLDPIFIKITQARHGILDRFGLALGKGMIRKAIVNGVTDALTKSLTTFDAKVNTFLAQRPMDKLMNTADGFVGKSYYAAQDRRAKSRAAKMRSSGAPKSSVPFMTKIKNTASKAARGIDTVAPTSLANQNNSSVTPVGQNWTNQSTYMSAPIVNVTQPIVSQQPVAVSTFETVPASSWSSKAAPVTQPSLGQDGNSVVTKITETWIPTSALPENLLKVEPGFQQKQQFTPTVNHIRTA